MMPKESFTPPLGGFSITILIYMVMAFAPYITVLLVSLVQEKELKLKELMRIMGTSDIAYWLSWVITYAVIMLFAVLILNAITIPGNIFADSNYLVIVIICYLYSLSVITMSFMLTPFFKKAKSAGLFASLVTTILGTIAIPLVLLDVSNAVKWVLSLFSPTAFALALSEVGKGVSLELKGYTRKGCMYNVLTKFFSRNQTNFSHTDLFSCSKHCPVFLFAGFWFVFEKKDNQLYSILCNFGDCKNLFPIRVIFSDKCITI